MSRLLLSACLAVALPAAAAAQAAGRAADGRSRGAASAEPAATAAAAELASVEQAACRVEDASQDSGNPNWLWRLRAYRALDCLIAMVDGALARAPADAAAAGGETDSAVAIAREDLERIRTWAWEARDAAARIGH